MPAQLPSVHTGDDIAAPISVREIGSFHVGGEIHTRSGLPIRERVSTPNGAVHVIDPNGEIIVGQMYVQYVRLTAPRSPHPLLLWHGGGMSGVNWETTPDGRPGWQMYFLRSGFDVYVSDAVERGRSSWAPYPDVYEGEPYFRTGKDAWEETFRFGPISSWHENPARRQAHPGIRFPVEHMERFMAQFVPRWDMNNQRTQTAYDALVAQLPPSILVTHSQGGQFGMTAALNAPEKIRAVISLEPSGAPDPARRDASQLSGVPHLFLWGDYLQRHPFWVESQPLVRRWYEALEVYGCDADWIDLPARGIRGNSHALMADNNSDQIASIVLNWLTARALVF